MDSPQSQTVFIACPTHDNRMDARTAIALFQQSSKIHNALIAIQNSSLLAHNCNNLWCAALNVRTKHSIKWFAMLHSDVIPEPFWLDKLIEIAEHENADMLSAVIPIKSSEGITSTAISKNGKVIKRITQTELHNTIVYDSFSIEMLQGPFDGTDVYRLLVNTGCMIVRIDQLWSDELYFTINDLIDRKFSQYSATVEPEDWFFSKLVAEKGGKVMATKAIQVTHIGGGAYDSQRVWGKAIDPLAE